MGDEDLVLHPLAPEEDPRDGQRGNGVGSKPRPQEEGEGKGEGESEEGQAVAAEAGEEAYHLAPRKAASRLSGTGLPKRRRSRAALKKARRNR